MAAPSITAVNERIVALRQSLDTPYGRSAWQDKLEKFLGTPICKKALQEMSPDHITKLKAPVNFRAQTRYRLAVAILKELSASAVINVSSGPIAVYSTQVWTCLRQWIVFFHPAAGNIVGPDVGMAALTISTLCFVASRSESLVSVLVQDATSLALFFNVWRLHHAYTRLPLPVPMPDNSALAVQVEYQFGTTFGLLLICDHLTFLRELLDAFQGNKKKIVELLTERAQYQLRGTESLMDDDGTDHDWKECIALIEFHAVLLRALVMHPGSEPSYPKAVTLEWLALLDGARSIAEKLHYELDAVYAVCRALGSLWLSPGGGDRRLQLSLKRGFIQKVISIAQGSPRVDVKRMDDTLDNVELCLVHRSAAFALPQALPKAGVDIPSIISVRLEDLRLCHAIMRRAESIEKRLMRICSNEMCTRHAMSGPLKRCPCGLAYYCSHSCQKADWRAQGRHRNECGLHAQYDLKISSRDWSHLNSLAVALVFDCRGEIFGHTRAVPLQDNILLDLDLRECGMVGPTIAARSTEQTNGLPRRQMYISLSVHYAGYELQSIIMPPFEDISEIRDADIDQLDSAEKQWWDRGGHYIRESVEDKHDTPA